MTKLMMQYMHGKFIFEFLSPRFIKSRDNLSQYPFLSVNLLHSNIVNLPPDRTNSIARNSRKL